MESRFLTHAPTFDRAKKINATQSTGAGLFHSSLFHEFGVEVWVVVVSMCVCTNEDRLMTV
jgi:hypothetical protein